MSAFDDWATKAHPGRCEVCGVEGLVFTYDVRDLCFVCSGLPYPVQSSEARGILHAVATVFYELRKPKKPRKQKQSKQTLVQLSPMTPAKGGKR